ncbi:putative GNAT family N-acetyltransferase [Fusarium tricinctum]|uniref:GNAT family N-acetyltransferase n=2 Tax=Fusarium tricinctum species complex TaxID=679429 RepID=A0A8K0RQU2_9HYPO|nr:putative GNAT family N-acetyltransferase [Fusarium tricinctum]
MGSHDSLNQAEGAPRFWYRDNFFLTNDKTYLCPKTFNKSLDDNWWSSPLPNGQLQRVLDNCLTLAVYHTPQTAEEMKKNGISQPKDGSPHKMVGFARVVTDYVTLAYLTDVFVVDEFQRRGLASWLMQALKEIVNEWKHMRGLLLMTHDQAAARLYQRELGAQEFEKGPSAGLVMLEMAGPAEKPTPKH